MTSLRSRYRSALLIVALSAAAAFGCHSDMYDQPKYEPLEGSPFFEDGRSARPYEPNVVPRGRPVVDGPRETGREGSGFVTEIPLSVDAKLLARGQERFTIYCTPCHGRLGDGDGMIVRRGFLKPPSFHTDRLRGLPVGHYFDVMTQGFGAMASYRKQISTDDRWAISAYIRALQLSRYAAPEDMTSVPLTKEERQHLDAAAAKPASPAAGAGGTK